MARTGGGNFDTMLFTRCPNCDTTFRITAEALGKASGQVRCGRCACVFDAYAELREERSPGEQAQGEAAVDAHTAAAATRAEFTAVAGAVDDEGGRSRAEAPRAGGPIGPEPENAAGPESSSKASAAGRATRKPVGSAEDEAVDAYVAESRACIATESELRAVTEAGFSVGTETQALTAVERETDESEEDWLAAADTFAEAAEAETQRGESVTTAAATRPAAAGSAGAAEPEVEVLDDYSVAAVLEQIESSRLAAAEEADAPVAPVYPSDPSARRASRAGTQAPRPASLEDISPQIAPAPGEANGDANGAAHAQRGTAPSWQLLGDAAASRRARGWLYATIAAAAVLGGQITNHFRSELAGVKGLGPLLSDVYAKLGVELIPSWDVQQYQIVDWVATAEPNANGRGSLKITARIQNKGLRAQPFPYVHLQLENRWEKSVASRMFEPEEYLPADEQPSALMKPGATTQAELEVVDPGRDAYGFELDVCIERPSRALVCAADEVFR
jgi:predicted Zn finger-like uncharacterized protein